MNASFEQNFVGIDVSKGTLDLAARGQSGTVQFENTSEGIRRMLAHLSRTRCPGKHARSAGDHPRGL